VYNINVKCQEIDTTADGWKDGLADGQIYLNICDWSI
jgi:hypothetical protein